MMMHYSLKTIRLFFAIAILSIVVVACEGPAKDYTVEVTYTDAQRDTFHVRAWEDYQIWLGSKGCLETTTTVIACGVRSIKILDKKISNQP